MLSVSLYVVKKGGAGFASKDNPPVHIIIAPCKSSIPTTLHIFSVDAQSAGTLNIYRLLRREMLSSPGWLSFVSGL